MESRPLTKLFNHSMPNLLSYQKHIKICSQTNKQSSNSSDLEAVQQQIKLYTKYEPRKRKLKNYEDKKDGLSKQYARGDSHLLFPKLNSEVIFLTNGNICSKRLIENVSLNCSRYVNFSTSAKKNVFWDKVIPYNRLGQVPTKLFAHKAEVEPLMPDGIGWAGQPIVKRIHPILPEVYGDVSDILNCVKAIPNSSKAQNDILLSLQMQTEPENMIQIDNIVQLEENESIAGLTNANVDEKTHSSLVLSTIGLAIPENNEAQSYNNISSLSKKGNCKINNEAFYKKSSDFALTPHKIIKSKNNELKKKAMIDTRLVKKTDIRLNKRENVLFKSPGVVVKKTKKKIRKKTKVCDSKTDLTLNFGDIKTSKKKKKKVKAFTINKKNKVEPQLVLNQHTSTHSFQRNVFHMENRQLKTDATLYYPRMSSEKKVKEKDSNIEVLDKNKRKKSSQGTSGTSPDKGSFDDDCVCPEKFVVKGKRRRTRICGVATGEGEKKKLKKFKAKMCLIEPQIKYRRKTYVCASKVHQRDKRKRQLPKCVKPEKKIAPRVEICLPNLIDELKKKSKICERPVEEVKIRKRTKVCKPIIILGKEVTEVKVEKSVCTTGVKKRRSRHTKICLPPEKDKKQMQLKN